MGRHGDSGGRQRRGPIRCGKCRGQIKWLRMRNSWRMFEPTPVDGRAHIGVRAHPVEGKFAWPTLRECVEDLMVRRRISSVDAEDEAYDMPWYVEHTCHARPENTTEESAGMSAHSASDPRGDHLSPRTAQPRPADHHGETICHPVAGEQP